MTTPPRPDVSSERSRPFLEIQYHPAEIRRSVRYFFLTRSQCGVVGAALAAWTFVVVFAVAVTPSVVGDLLAAREYRHQVMLRKELGGLLEESVEDLAELDRQGREVGTELGRIYLAYGFSDEESLGKGGFPSAPIPVPESIYADVVRRGSALHRSLVEQVSVLDTFHQEIESFESLHRDQVRTTPSISPLASDDFVLTSPFGTRRSPFTKEVDFHAGIDMAAPTGTPIYAPANGVVAFSGRYPLKQSVGWWRYGNLVALRNGDRFITLFGHCDELMVRTGETVEQGQVLATVGNTGWSTSPHLHYEVRRKTTEDDFRPVDPRIYILDHQWRDQEKLLVRARSAPDTSSFEPLPRLLQR